MAPSGREREKKDDQQQKTFFGEKEKKLEVIPKKREEGKNALQLKFEKILISIIKGKAAR